MGLRDAARLIRAQLVQELSRRQAKILFDHELEQGEMAEAIGSSHSLVQRQCDKRRKESARLVDVVLLHRAGHGDAALELLRWAAEHLGARVELAGDVSQPAGFHALTRDIFEACAHLQRTLLDSDRAGAVDAMQREMILARLALVDRQLQALRSWLAHPVLERKSA